MAFFKRIQKKVNNMWYPQSVTWGKAVTTREVADELSVLSTVTRGDTYAVMENLGRVLSSYMGQGRTVKIDGVGTFYYTANTSKNGVATAEEVSSSQINGVRVRFIPEVERSSSNQIMTRSMVNTKIVWEEWGGDSTNTSGSTDNTGGESGEGGSESGGSTGGNPLG
ncbi:MAG: DNA-binding protein [Bacteroides sp.]|nr:DNA-binding protein [Bacteroides sp.]